MGLSFADRRPSSIRPTADTTIFAETGILKNLSKQVEAVGRASGKRRAQTPETGTPHPPFATDPAKSAWPWYAAVSSLIVICLAAYANSWDGVFVYDEISEIANNPAIRQLWPPAVPMFQGGDLPHRPLPYYSFAINYALSGQNVWSYHALNLLIHLLAGLTLFGIIRRTLTTTRLAFDADLAIGVAWATTAIWLAHPLQTQAVTYIYQRMESLMALFYLLTLYAFVRSTTAAKPLGWRIASITFCALGMLCKEVMISAPLLVLWYDRTLTADNFAAALARRRVYYAALASTWIGLLAVILAQQATYGELSTPRWSTFAYAINQPQVILHYLALFVWPSGQCLDYWWIPQLDLPVQAPLVTLITLLAGYVLYGAWKGWASSLLVGSFFLILGPTSSFLAVADVCVEHRVYLPLAALALGTVLLALTGWRAIAKACQLSPFNTGWLALAAVSGVVLLLISLTLARNELYASRLLMWSDVVNKAPHNPRGHLNAGQTLRQQGDLGIAGSHYTEAIRLDPQYAAAYVNRGNLLLELGLTDAALADFNQAIQQAGSRAEAYNGRAVALRRLGRDAEALADYNRATELAPGDPSGYRNRALLLAERGDRDQAAADVATYVQLGGDLDPDFVAQMQAWQVLTPAP